MKLRKILSVILSILIISAALGVTAYAAETPQFQLVDATGYEGDIVRVPLYINNNPGIVSLQVQVSYSSNDLELQGVTNGGLFTDPLSTGDLSSNPVTISWFASDISNTKDSGLFADLVFEIKKGAKTSDVKLTYDPENVFDNAFSNKTFSVKNAKVTVSKPTTITAKAAKSKIYVGAKTTITAKVTNAQGKTTYKSSNTKVATVSSTGVVKGIKAGTVKITATNNGASSNVTVKVVKKANPMTAKANAITANAKKNTSIAQSKAFTIKKAQGKVTFKKASGDKKITIAKNGNITVKKGLKKNKTYNLKVKVTAAGNSTYSAITKAVTVKIKIK